MKTKTGAIVCLAAIIVWNASGCGGCPIVYPQGVPTPSNLNNVVYVKYHFINTFDKQGSRQARTNGFGGFIPDKLPGSGACPTADDIQVDDAFESPFSTTAAWKAQDPDMYHDTGGDDGLGDGGWIASPYRYDAYGNLVTDSSGWLLYGPNPGMNLSVGNHAAAWNLMIDDNTSDNVDQVYIDVYDITTNTVLASQNITRNQFPTTYAYIDWTLNFTVNNANDQIEFRCFWYGGSTITVEGCGVAVR